MISIGEKTPTFSIPGTEAQDWSNTSFSGSYLVLYFYPKDSTPGCTKEGIAFTELYPEFKQLNAQIAGVSRDSVRKHENFKAKQNFCFPLLADTEEVLCKIFDVIKLKKLYGREYLGIERSTFLIDPDGILIKEWRKVKVSGHAQEVLEALNELGQ